MSFTQNKKVNIHETSWSEIKNEIKTLNPVLYEIIEQLNPSPKLTLYRLKYPYGAKIINNGRFQLVTEASESIELSDEIVPKQVQEALNYRSIPLSMVLHNASEVFIESDQRIVPMRVLQPGELFGVFEALDSPHAESSASVTNVTAGARSAFMLAKISDKTCHKRLVKELGIHSHLPKGLTDHGLVFAEIGNHAQFAHQWHNEILFFSKNWFKEQKDNSGWLRFMCYLHETAWKQSQYWRTQTMFGLLWKVLINAITDRNIRPRPYLIDTLKHLIFMATGAVPGFTPANSELTLPAKLIQEVYLESYSLKSHTPIIMVPHHFSLMEPDTSVYYSLSHPTLLEYSLNPKLVPTIIEDLREIKLLMHLLENKLKLQNDQLYEFLKEVIFEFFTCEPDVQGKITSSNELPNLDKNLYDADRTFPATSTFLRGCIRILKRDKK